MAMKKAANQTMPFPNIKTDPTLVDRIEKAARTPSTPQESHAARVAFVHGNLPQKVTLDRTQVEAIIANIEGVRA